MSRRRSFPPPLLLVLALLAPAAGAQGAERRIEPGSDRASIQAVLDASADGDTISFAPGHYEGPLVVRSKGLLIRGEPGTVFDSGWSGRAIETRRTGNPVVIEDVVFRRNRASAAFFPDDAGGAVAALVGPLHLRRCTFEDNAATGIGGAVYCTTDILANIGSPLPADDPADVILLVEDCVFRGNTASGVGGGFHADGTDVVVRRTEFADNRATQGGAWSQESGSGFAETTRFSGNEARNDGGAIRVSGFGPYGFLACRFESNRAERFGGAIALESVGASSLSGCVFLGNASGFEGAGVFARRTRLNVGFTLFADGVAGGDGGGIHLDEPNAGRTFRSTFVDNRAASGEALSVRLGTYELTGSILGEASPTAVRCRSAGSVTGGCNLALPATDGCAPVAARGEVARCPSDPAGLCRVPVIDGCGAVGHADEPCEDGGCLTSRTPIRWGGLKLRYR